MKKSIWERLLLASSVAERMFPEAALAGVSSLIPLNSLSHEKISSDVLHDVQSHFNEMTERLEHLASIGEQRSLPLETESINVDGVTISLPTPEEMLRVKTHITLNRNEVSDYCDMAQMTMLIGLDRSSDALMKMDEIYPNVKGDAYHHRMQALKQFHDPQPVDGNEYYQAALWKASPPFNSWNNVQSVVSKLSSMTMDKAVEAGAEPSLISRIENWRARRAGPENHIGMLPGMNA